MGALCGTAAVPQEETDSGQKVPKEAGDDGEKEAQPAHDDEVPCYKLLLLGSGESGKSTFFKRLMMKYGRGYPQEDRQEFIESIYENTIESMKTLIHQSKYLDEKENCQIDPSCAGAVELIEGLRDEETITDKIAAAIETLWEDKGIRNTFELRSAFQVPDSASYFFSNVKQLAKDSYIPTEEDVLRCRDRTTGVTHEVLKIRSDAVKGDFDMYDVGGQRSERRHWVRIFQNVKTVLFVVAISEYDQLCFEDETTNRLDDSLSVFKMVASSKHFEDTPIVLLFNKVDLFQEKLKRGVEFNFEGYSGEQDFDAVSQFIKSKFESRNETGKKVVTRFVSAIAPEFDFDDVFKVVVQEAQAD